MKAIRSLEQHVDSLLSYDFSGLTQDELLAQGYTACGQCVGRE